MSHTDPISSYYDQGRVNELESDQARERAHKASVAASEAAFAAEWTAEVTDSRKAAWNAYMLDAKAAGRQVNILVAQKAVGFTFDDLKRAIALNK